MVDGTPMTTCVIDDYQPLPVLEPCPVLVEASSETPHSTAPLNNFNTTNNCYTPSKSVGVISMKDEIINSDPKFSSQTIQHGRNSVETNVDHINTSDNIGQCTMVYEERPVDIPKTPSKALIMESVEREDRCKQSHEEMAAEVLIELSGNTEGASEHFLINNSLQKQSNDMTEVENIPVVLTPTRTGDTQKPAPLSWKDYAKSKERAVVQLQIKKELFSASPDKSKVIVIKPTTKSSRTKAGVIAPQPKRSTIIHVPTSIDRAKWHSKFGKNKLSKTSENTPNKKPKLNMECQVCSHMFSGAESLIKHVANAHKDYAQRDDYINYLRTDLDRLCPICGETTCTNAELQVHILSNHDDGSLICPLCVEEKVFKSKQSMRQHIRAVHFRNFMQYKCDVCELHFTEKRTLEEHINCMHEKKNKFPCDICVKVFLSKSRMRRHRLIHGDFRYFCPVCKKGFHVRDSMNKHNDLVHSNPEQMKKYLCNICSKSFTVKGNLKQHLLGVHMKRFNFNCSICSRGYQRQKTLDEHILKHKKISPFLPGSTSKDIGPESFIIDMRNDRKAMDPSTEELIQGMTREEESSIAAQQLNDIDNGYDIIQLPIEHINMLDTVDVPEPSQETTI